MHASSQAYTGVFFLGKGVARKERDAIFLERWLSMPS